MQQDKSWLKDKEEVKQLLRPQKERSWVKAQQQDKAMVSEQIKSEIDIKDALLDESESAKKQDERKQAAADVTESEEDYEF